MNPIKAFFKRKQVDANFKKAGPGHRLSDDSSSSHQSQRTVRTPPRRLEPNEVARRAGEAALARQQNQTTNVNWSLAAVRAQARKELDLELQAEKNAKTSTKEVYKESCELLTVSGVYFTCPLVGPYVLSKKEIELKIKEFLYSQIEEEPGLTACLIIYSCNRDPIKIKLGVETISKYLTNIIDNPTEEKYHKIRINNKVFQEKVSSMEGAVEFLTAAGFERKQLQQGDQEEDFFVFPEIKLSDTEHLQMLKEALHSAEPILPILDRNVKILMPSQVTQNVNLPEAFFHLSIDEVKKEQELKAQAVELNNQLRTKAMREKDDIRDMRIYKYTLIRVKFPDGIILQGTFKVTEKLNEVKEFVIEHLANPSREFILLAPGGIKLTKMDETLMGLKLIPAAILNLHWVIEDDRKEIAYLKMETMSLLQNA